MASCSSATVGGTTVTYRYDALGRRVARVQGSQVTQYLYGDPGNAIRVTATRSDAGVLTTYYYDDDGLSTRSRATARGSSSAPTRSARRAW